MEEKSHIASIKEEISVVEAKIFADIACGNSTEKDAQSIACGGSEAMERTKSPTTIISSKSETEIQEETVEEVKPKKN